MVIWSLKVTVLFSLFIAFIISFGAHAEELPRASEMREQERLEAVGFEGATRLYLRLFKQEKILEVWLKSGPTYKLYKSFDICKFSGKLGPKIAEGDKQAPEGFYHVPAEDVLWNSRKWPRALNLAFPNIFDGVAKRTGSFLLIHGGCSSVGCYALKNGPMSVLYDLVSIALRKGQKLIPIHIFPFRFTKQNWQRHKDHKFKRFWQVMQPVYNGFNENRTLPSIMVCQSGYQVYASEAFVDDPNYVKQGCLQPLPLGSEVVPDLASLSWVGKLKERYKALLKKSRRDVVQKGSQIRVKCNLKRPSCKRWLSLRKRMLKRGTLPKSLLR
ncbi:hypothetical protein NBRC116602_01340 [Hyphomicrobiales bacterium 4NK60-0047b]